MHVICLSYRKGTHNIAIQRNYMRVCIIIITFHKKVTLEKFKKSFLYTPNSTDVLNCREIAKTIIIMDKVFNILLYPFITSYHKEINKYFKISIRFHP